MSIKYLLFPFFLINKLKTGLYTAFHEVITNIYFLFVTCPSVLPIPIILDSTTLYINDKTNKFLKSFTDVSINEKINTSIDSVFYSKSFFNDLLATVDNKTELQWKSRILFESTPRGNIVMFYDIFKQGFSYYSDINGIPYSILNAVAMKYVITYFCRDFFVDNQVTIDYAESPLIKIHFEDPPINIEQTKYNSSRLLHNMEYSPFAKLKNYANNNTATNKKIDNSSSLSSNKNVAQPLKPVPEKEYNRNRFIFLGKLSNFKFTQLVSKPNTNNHFMSTLVEDLNGNISNSSVPLSYLEFKRHNASKHKNTIC